MEGQYIPSRAVLVSRIVLDRLTGPGVLQVGMRIELGVDVDEYSCVVCVA